MVRQTGSIHLQPEEQQKAHALLNHIFQFACFYTYAVPTYIGGLFSTLFCSESINPLDVDPENIQEKYEITRIKTRYYHPYAHVGAFYVPNFLKFRMK